MKNPLPLLLALASTALANDTALHDGRFGPEPLDATNGAESAVRMEREHLEISFGAQFTEVHCTFTFRNTRRDGAIGRLQADITLRDGLKVGGLVWPGAKMAGGRLVGDEEKFATHPARDAWQVLDETHVRLVWNDFEPRTQKDRRGFSLSRPFHGW